VAFDRAFGRAHHPGNLLNAHPVQGLELKSEPLFSGNNFSDSRTSLDSSFSLMIFKDRS